ncbi:MAG: GNAT family N-acetyltransferase [Desulfobulbaceae bacterium]|nr:GNAT family N-acetyltransferase [Desulfobulbaceae bacterium]
MLDFHPLTVENFRCFEEHILRSEAVFPEAIRESSADYLSALKRERSIGLVAHLAKDYVGNVVGYAPCPEQRRELRLSEAGAEKSGLVYLFNIVTLPDYQGQGLGRRLLGEFLEVARANGFRKVGGHFRGNGSLANFRRLGGRELAAFED